MKHKKRAQTKSVFAGMSALGIAMCRGLAGGGVLGNRGVMVLYKAAGEDDGADAQGGAWEQVKTSMQKLADDMTAYEATMDDEEATEADKTEAKKSHQAAETKWKSLEAKLERAKAKAARNNALLTAKALGQTVAPGHIPNGVPAEAKNHEADENAKVNAFTDWFSSPFGAKMSDSMRDALTPKSQRWDFGNKSNDASAPFALPKSLMQLIVGKNSQIMSKAQPLSSDQSSPGNLYQAQIMTDLMQYRGEAAKLFPLCKKIPTVNGIVHYPRLKQSVPGAEGSATEFGEYGGVATAWTAEGAEAGAAEPQFDQVQYPTYQLSATTALTRQLINRSVIDLPGLLTSLYGKAISHKIDLALLNGDGNGKPVGILNTTGIGAPARNAGSGSNVVQYEDFVNCESLIPPDERDRMVYIVADTAMQYAKKLKDSNGRPLFLPTTRGGFDIGAADYGRILNHPVITTQRTTLGAKGDIIAVVPEYYICAIEQELVIMANPYTKMGQNSVQYFAFMQVGGALHEPRCAAALAL